MNTNTPDLIQPEAAPSTAASFYNATGYTSDDSVGYLMRRILNSMAHGIDLELEPTGLTNAQWLPLHKLYCGCGSTAAELARECNLDAGSMTRLLDRLQAKQLCQRVRSQDDRRVVHIKLTEAGIAAAQNIPAALCRVQNAHLAGFSVQEWQTLRSYLRRMLDTAQSLQATKDDHGT